MKNSDEKQFMNLTLNLVSESIKENLGGPFGSIITRDNEVIAKGVNRVTSTNDPTAHGEVVAIRNACEALNTFNLSGCHLYTNCEPCPMCLSACYWARIDKIFFAVNREDAKEIGFDDAYFYEQVCKPINERDIPMTQCMREEALALFKEWDQKEDKMRY
ncbi:MAG: nucleoside deaminase [Gammaproteobacteria bacterium]|nr:nucleoside deaminase [Gammaproteobacteria bacterium]